MEFEVYFQEWLNGLEEEIFFWDDYMKTGGGAYKEDFEWTVKRNKPFTLEDEIESNDSCSFLDVGSGPFSRCGSVTKKTKLRVTAVDPLGSIYETLKERYNLNSDIIINTGFVELLDQQFLDNSFDIVHMSNSLDHSFDPVFGIYQLLRVCKIGGKVILRHAENEAENENYKGLHQWNLSLKKRENEFWAWNKYKEINITEVFRTYADISCFPDIIEGDGARCNWKYNKVIMEKKQNIELPGNDYYDKMLRVVYNCFLSKLLELNALYEEKKKLVEALSDNTALKFNRTNIKRCAVYCMNKIRKKLHLALERVRMDNERNER